MSTDKNQSERRSISGWQVESLRFTAFPAPTAVIGEPTWWQDVTGEPPEKRMVAPKRGALQEEGQFEGGRLILSVQPMRIDWVVTAHIAEGKELETFPTIGPFNELLGTFLVLIERWFQSETAPIVKRIALGATLVQAVENKHIGYEQLARYLRTVDIDPSSSSDFLYQINRPRVSASGIADLKINRLSKWSVAGWRSALLAVTPASVEQAMGPESFACRLELDINTAADFVGPLPRDGLPKVIQELANLGQEIARDGDVA